MKSLIMRIKDKLRKFKKPKRDMSKKFGEGNRDIVDEASWESFPASDPPSYNH